GPWACTASSRLKQINKTKRGGTLHTASNSEQTEYLFSRVGYTSDMTSQYVSWTLAFRIVKKSTTTSGGESGRFAKTAARATASSATTSASSIGKRSKPMAAPTRAAVISETIALADNARLLRARKDWHGEQLEEALAGVHQAVAERVMAQLENLKSARALG